MKDNNIDKIDSSILTEQMQALRQAITDLQGAGLYVSSSLTLQYDKVLHINISATNNHPKNSNLNIPGLYPRAVIAPHI